MSDQDMHQDLGGRKFSTGSGRSGTLPGVAEENESNASSSSKSFFNEVSISAPDTSGPMAAGTAQRDTRKDTSEDIESHPVILRLTSGMGDLTEGWSERFEDMDVSFPELRRKLRLKYKKKIRPFWKLIVAQIGCVIYILVFTFSYPPIGIRDPETNNIIDPNSEENTNNGVIYVNGDFRPVVAIGGWQKFCLAISRMSAFSMFPMMVVVFTSKMKALNTFFSKTPISMYIHLINESHEFHEYAGRYIAIDVWIHTVFHLLRWAWQGNIYLLGRSDAGRSGLATIICTPLITFPMMYWKRQIPYEIRKALHYLFYVFAVVMCFHVPVSAIPNGGFLAPILAGCICIYTLDAAYVYFKMTEKIETTSFHVLSSGVRISMPVSERFQNSGIKGGFAYVCIPWIDDKQWHPFSLFEDPDDPSVQQMFLMKTGDWTTDVHKSLSRDTTRPCWIQGPFPSPYSYAASYDNQILVASGIGITPALAAIVSFKNKRRVNLIWAVRDPEMLEFFLEQMYLDHDGWNLIFYTGKKPLRPDLENSSTNVQVVKGRPKLDSVIPNVIYGIESKEGLPEKYTQRSKDEMKRRLMERIHELDNDPNVRASDKVSTLVEYGDSLGFSMQELIDEIQPSDKARASFLRASSNCSEPEPQGDEERNASELLKELKTSAASNSGWESFRSGVSERSLGDEEETIKERVNKHLSRTKSTMHWSNVTQSVGRDDANKMMAPTFLPWEDNTTQERCVRRFGEEIMKTWGIMYCGGSKPVIKSLRVISDDYNIDLNIDSFAW